MRVRHTALKKSSSVSSLTFYGSSPFITEPPEEGVQPLLPSSLALDLRRNTVITPLTNSGLQDIYRLNILYSNIKQLISTPYNEQIR